MENVLSIQNNQSTAINSFDCNFSRIETEFLNLLQVKEETIRTYRKGIKQFFLYLEEQGIRQPGRTDIINYIQSLKDKGLKPTSIKSYIASIKALYKFIKIQYKQEDITTGIKTPLLNSGFKKECLTVAQTKDLINNTSELRDKIIILLGATCGLRTVEISRLNREDLEIRAGKPILWILGKARDEKEYIVIPDKLHRLINEYLGTRTDNKQPLLLATSNRSQNGRLATGSISRIIKTHLRQIGINSEKVTAHSLRHTAITLSLISGNGIRETQQLARHKNINTTLIYAHDLEKINNKCSNSIMAMLKD